MRFRCLAYVFLGLVLSFCSTAGLAQGSWSEFAKLTPTGADGDENDLSVAVSGDTAVGIAQRGVYVYAKSGRWTSMTQTAVLTSSDGQQFGRSVAIDGDTIVIGAPFTDGVPAVYVFVKPAGGWVDMTETAKLTASDTTQLSFLGGVVSISGDTIASGAIGKGSAYVFVKPAGGWTNATETAELTPASGSGAVQFGGTIGVSGNVVVVGAIGTTVKGLQDVGACFVFVKPARGWKNMTQNAVLIPSRPKQLLFMGQQVGISGDTIVAGAPLDMVNGNKFAGAVFLFAKPTNGWTSMTETALLTASDGTSRDEFGFSTAISGNTVIVGANLAAVNGNPGQGAVYTFDMPLAGWASMTETSKLTLANGRKAEGFGFALDITGNTIISAAPFTDLLTGAAYIYGR
jgi:hypothetical protein